MKNQNRVTLGTRENDAENDLDFFPTPSYIVRSLLEAESFKGEILEPCCGTGSIVEVLKKGVNLIVWCDIIDRGYPATKIEDFVKSNRVSDNIITNPPFNQSKSFMLRALRAAKRKVALLLPIRYQCGKWRHAFFERYPPKKILILPEKVDFLGLGRPAQEFMWVIWDKDYVGPTIWEKARLKEKMTQSEQYILSLENNHNP